ncbi:MAG: SDR family NAD(P)-dependent oxidoreductase [Pseudomonadota bacterium]
MSHPALASGSVAVITGAASGIGLASALTFSELGMKLALVDQHADKLEAASAAANRAGAGGVLAVTADVSNREEMEALAGTVADQFGAVHILMNNAGIGGRSSCLSSPQAWDDVLGVNFRGVLNGTQVFGPGMIEHGQPGAIINTGSKQGITTPPGNPAYNVSKAALKVFTEALAHELRNTPGHQITAHLLIPGFVHTGMTGGGAEKPAAAWTAEETVDFFVESLGRGEFYILCPDNDVPRALDERRMAWAAGDIIENRPALSRWHPDYKDAFEAFVKE